MPAAYSQLTQYSNPYGIYQKSYLNIITIQWVGKLQCKLVLNSRLGSYKNFSPTHSVTGMF